MASVISQLPAKEKQALELCGITQDSQLQNADVEALVSDLHMAQRYFPEQASALTDARVRTICSMANSTLPSRPDLQEDAETEPEEARVTIEAGTSVVSPTRAYPTLSPRRHQHRSAKNTILSHKEAPGKSHSVHCSRPLGTYLGALTMLLAYIGMVGLLLTPALLLMGYIDEKEIVKTMIMFGACVVPYVLHGAWVPCSVCNMHFFMLRPYNINRHAHKIPLFGWTTLATALHIVFLGWYRCPACGTSLRLSRHRH